MSGMIDRFGENAAVCAVDKEYFKAAAAIVLSDNFYDWVSASGGTMRILGPEKAVEQF